MGGGSGPVLCFMDSGRETFTEEVVCFGCYDGVGGCEGWGGGRVGVVKVNLDAGLAVGGCDEAVKAGKHFVGCFERIGQNMV